MGSTNVSNDLLKCWDCLSLLNWIGAFTLSLLLKIPSRKLEVLFILSSFFLTRFLFISVNLTWPCMEYCSQIWLGAPSYYSDIIDKLQKRVCRTVGLTRTVFLESLGHQRNVASSIFFCWYYFGICSSELAELVPLPFSVRRYMHYFDSLHDISVALRECYINFYVNIVFLRAARL